MLHKPTEANNNAMSSSDLRELFEACKTGDLVKVKKLLTPQNVNEIGKTGRDGRSPFSRLLHGFVSVLDTAGRRSTALHFASGYGRKDIVEFLLANGANISAKDDGGLMPLHK